MERPPAGRRKGCLVWFAFAILALLAGLLFGAWRLRIIRLGGMEPISNSAAQLREAPVDPAASQAVTSALAKAGLAGVKGAVAPLPGASEGNAAMLVIDPAAGFKPAPGAEGKKKQARAAIKQLVQTNAQLKLNLERVGLEYRESGQAWVALSAPMSALQELDAGKITEAQFLSTVDVKLLDPAAAQNLLNRFR